MTRLGSAVAIVVLVVLGACARLPQPEQPEATPEATRELAATPEALARRPTQLPPASPTARPTAEMSPAAATPHVMWLPAVAYTPPRPLRGWAKAYSNLSDAEMRSLQLNVYYDYALRYPFPHRAGVMYIPYLWCDIYPSLRYESPVIRYFDQLARLPDGYDGHLLFLNEPDLAGGRSDGMQCERTPRQAAHMLVAARLVCPNCVIVGPSVSHEDYRRGWPWLREFYNHAVGLGVRLPDVAGIHSYLPEEPNLIVDDLFEMLDEFPGTAETVWVTEFAGGEAQAAQMIEYYEADERVEAYFWFTARGWVADLVGRDGTLTPLGEIYRGSQANGAEAAYP